MNKRVWIAVAVGGVVGGVAVVGFGPLVRSQIQTKAERYGVVVSVEHVVPTLGGVRLRGVAVTLPAVPGVRLWLDDVVVGWTDKHPKSMSGGRITAVGEIDELARAVEAWRADLLTGSGDDTGSGRPFDVSGFELDYKNKETDPSQSLRATGLHVARGDGTLEIEAESLSARRGATTLDVKLGRVALAKQAGAYRITVLSSGALTIDVGRGIAAQELGASVPSLSAPDTQPTPGEPATTANAVVADPTKLASHQRVHAAKKIHGVLLGVGKRLDGLLAPDAKIDVKGARAKLALGDETLNLGPGSLSVVREAGDLVVSLAPDSDGGSNGEALTFSVRLPLSAESAPISGKLHGGPLGLGLLGVREGDLGLEDVDGATLECDMSVVLEPDGERIRLDGGGKLHRLSLSKKSLAEEPLTDVELAWHAKVIARLDGSELEIREGEVDLGAVRALVSGRYRRHADGHRVDADFEIPLMSCQAAFDSVPRALVPKLTELRFAGSLAMKGHAHFDTANLVREYDVDWDGDSSCRIVEAPHEIQPSRFKSRFTKLVYTPGGDETTQEMGPETDGWVPLGAMSRYMPSAVLTTEDGRFFRHGGFDKEAIINSIRENLKAGHFVRGASTISMQLAKNLYLPRTKTVSRKLQEAVLTLYLEQELTKDEIMELYLNVIEYGPMVYGIGPAAQHYFSSSASRLSLGQSLYLAAILSNPKQQFFGAGGAVTPARMAYLRTLMKVVHKIKRISDEELALGLRETVVMGSPSILAPPDADPYEPDAGDTEPPDPLEQPVPPG